MNRRWLKVVGVSVFPVLCSPPALAQPPGVIGYETTIVPTLQGHRSSSAIGLDEVARVIGRSTPFSGASTPLAWVDGQIFAVPAPPNHHGAVVNGISPTTGIIVGYALADANSLEQATAWRIGSGIHVLSNLPDTIAGIAMAVEDTPWPMTRIVGRCAAFGPDYASLWVNEHVIDIGGISSAANDVNEADQIVGWWRNQMGAYRPVLWQNSQRIDLGGEPPDASGDAYSINGLGEIVGHLSGLGPVLWRDGQRVALPAPSPCWTIPHAINDEGIIVGEYNIDAQCRAGYEHALLWTLDQGQYIARDLNELNALHPEIELTQAWDINSGGQIAAVGKLSDGNRRGVLLTPYHFTLDAPAPGIAGQWNMIVATGAEPGATITLVWGTSDGARPINGGCGGAPILIRNPKIAGTSRADAKGNAEFRILVPPQGSGVSVRFQALSASRCEVSHVVAHTFD